MRTIPLKEHETSFEALSPAELDDLLRTDLVRLTPGPGGTYGIRPASVVGTAVLPHLRLHIEPKLAVGNLVFLLAYGLGIARLGDDEFPYEADDPLTAALAWLYANQVRLALRRGLMRGYEPREEALEAPVGAIAFARQFARRQSLPNPIECNFEEFTTDTRMNQILRAAHSLLLRRTDVSAPVHSLLRHQVQAFEGVRDVHFDPSRVPSPSFSRLSEHWRSPIGLARLIIEGAGVNHREESLPAPAFTINMNHLFERFITAVVRDVARGTEFGVLAQEPRPFTEAVGLRPDLLLTRAGADVGVADIKYKETEAADFKHPDLYQVFAYCSALNLPRGLLIYGGRRELEQQQVVGSGIEIQMIGVDLDGTPPEILTSARTAARAFLLGHREDPPLAGGALQLVDAAVGELQT
jgi:5-methylcytosine-specific restriction enzyme subunit McrC